MVANAEGTKSTRAVAKKRLSKTPAIRKKVLSKKVLTKKSPVKKPASQKQPMVVNLNLCLNFVMPDGLSSPGGVGNGLTLNLNDILEQQRAGSSTTISSSGRRSTGQAVVKGKLTKKIGVQKAKKVV